MINSCTLYTVHCMTDYDGFDSVMPGNLMHTLVIKHMDIWHVVGLITTTMAMTKRL